MDLITALCVVVAVLGLILIIIGVIPQTAATAPGLLPAGITLLVIGVAAVLIVYVVRILTGAG